MSEIIHAGHTDAGRVREVNEDRWLAERSMGLYAVIDGMGGTAGGEMAARMVVDNLPAILRKHLRGVGKLTLARAAERVRTALAELSSRVYYEGFVLSDHSNPGATLVLALIWDEQAILAHLGDSRAYLFREGNLQQLTKDHSAVQRLIDLGEITADQAMRHPSYGKITRFIGMREAAVPDLQLLDLQANDTLLLCTDGLTDMLSVPEMTGLLALGLTPKETCRLFVDAANLAGGEDNITALIVAVKEKKAAKRRDHDQHAVPDPQENTAPIEAASLPGPPLEEDASS